MLTDKQMDNQTDRQTDLFLEMTPPGGSPKNLQSDGRRLENNSKAPANNSRALANNSRAPANNSRVSLGPYFFKFWSLKSKKTPRNRGLSTLKHLNRV